MTGLVIVILMIGLFVGGEWWSEHTASETWQWKQDVKWLVKHGSRKPAVRRMRWAETKKNRPVLAHRTVRWTRALQNSH